MSEFWIGARVMIKSTGETATIKTEKKDFGEDGYMHMIEIDDYNPGATEDGEELHEWCCAPDDNMTLLH